LPLTIVAIIRSADLTFIGAILIYQEERPNFKQWIGFSNLIGSTLFYAGKKEGVPTSRK
jgi:hypothetical protein